MMVAATIAGALTVGDFKKKVSRGFDAPPNEDPEEWLPSHIRFPSGSEEAVFDFDEAPYCRGVVDLFWKDTRRRKANLCWGVRLGKTSLVLALLSWQAINNPCPMALLFPDNDLLQSGVDDHVWPMFEATPVVRSQLPPRHLWNKRVIRFQDCRIRLASAGKKSSVSGYPARIIGKVEHDKCPTRKSSEADPSARMDSRAAGYPTGVKIIEEGSPSERETSRVGMMLADPDVAKFYFHVPCPHCKKFQPLEFENIEWEKDKDTGKSTAGIARKTARYICPSCKHEIKNEHRREMIQGGVWAAEGQHVTKRGHRRGTPKAGDDYEDMVFCLSSLYSLRLSKYGWGDLASEFVKAKRAADQGRVGPLQKFWNEKLGRVWDPRVRKTKPHKVAARLKSDDHQKLQIIPSWASFLTMTADVGGAAETLFFYYMTMAWGCVDGLPRGGVIDWSIIENKGDFLSWWKDAEYETTAGVPYKLWGQPAAIDSGNWSEEIYQFTKPIRGAWPLKADSRKNDVDVYRLGYTQAGHTARQVRRKKKRGQPDLFLPSTDLTQGWRVALVEGRLTMVDT